MPKLIIHADANPSRSGSENCINDYCIGHFYIELQGEGLDEGKLALFQKSQSGSIYIGFNPGNMYSVGKLTDEYIARRINTLGLPQGMLSKIISLTDIQFEALRVAVESKIIDQNEVYVAFVNDCIDFVQDMYQASGQSGYFNSLFTSEELDSVGVAGLVVKYYDQKATLRTISGEVLSSIVDLSMTVNQYLNDRIFVDSTGNQQHIIINNVDTLTVPDPDIPTAYVTKTLVVGTDSPDLLTANGNIVFANNGTDTITVSANSGRNTIEGGYGFDTVSYAASSQPIDVDLSAGNIVRGEAMVEQVVDTVINVEGVTGTDYNDAFRGTPKAHSAVRFEGGKGDDSYELYGSDKTAYTLVDNEGNNRLEVNGHPLTGTAQPVTNRPEGTTFTLKAEDNSLYILTRINDGGVVDIVNENCPVFLQKSA